MDRRAFLIVSSALAAAEQRVASSAAIVPAPYARRSTSHRTAAPLLAPPFSRSASRATIAGVDATTALNRAAPPAN
jgi:hypothetical protein